MFLLSFLRLFVLMFYPSLYPPSNDLDTSPYFVSVKFCLSIRLRTYNISFIAPMASWTVIATQEGLLSLFICRLYCTEGEFACAVNQEQILIAIEKSVLTWQRIKILEYVLFAPRVWTFFPFLSPPFMQLTCRR